MELGGWLGGYSIKALLTYSYINYFQDSRLLSEFQLF
jgi:hypothetical protein